MPLKKKKNKTKQNSGTQSNSIVIKYHSNTTFIDLKIQNQFKHQKKKKKNQTLEGMQPRERESTFGLGDEEMEMEP